MSPVKEMRVRFTREGSSDISLSLRQISWPIWCASRVPFRLLCSCQRMPDRNPSHRERLSEGVRLTWLSGAISQLFCKMSVGQMTTVVLGPALNVDFASDVFPGCEVVVDLDTVSHDVWYWGPRLPLGSHGVQVLTKAHLPLLRLQLRTSWSFFVWSRLDC